MEALLDELDDPVEEDQKLENESEELQSDQGEDPGGIPESNGEATTVLSSSIG